MRDLDRVLHLLKGDPQADRAVPPTGLTARLAVFTWAAMAFLAVFAVAPSLATGRLAALAADAQVIRVMRLVGARDETMARAFVRRFTLRAGAGALGGTVAGLAAMALLPSADTEGGFLTGLGRGLDWLAPLLPPVLAAATAFVATRAAALRTPRAQA